MFRKLAFSRVDTSAVLLPECLRNKRAPSFGPGSNDDIGGQFFFCFFFSSYFGSMEFFPRVAGCFSDMDIYRRP